MPINPEMRWEENQKRWVKEYRKKLYSVSAKKLGGTGKTDTVRAANAWWLAKRVEVDAVPAADMPHDAALVVALEQNPQAIPGLLADDPEALRAILATYYQNRPIQAQRIENRVAKATATIQACVNGDDEGGNDDLTIGGQYSLWCAGIKAKNKAASTKHMRIHRLGIFIDWIGEKKAAGTLNETDIRKFYHWLKEQEEYGEEYRQRIWIDTANFVKFLWEGNVLPNLPRNLKSSEWEFEVTAKKLYVPKIEEVRTFLDGCRGQTELHVLLMLNCGMAAKDIADLKDSEVDWEKGTITRKRSKTTKIENAPTVTYTLWKRTLRLLREERSGKETVLLTKSGKPWVVQDDSGEKYTNSNCVASNFRQVRDWTNTKITPQQLRRFTVNVFKDHKEYRPYTQYFLAQTPEGTIEKHYLEGSTVILAEMTAWLEGQIFPPKKAKGQAK